MRHSEHKVTEFFPNRRHPARYFCGREGILAPEDCLWEPTTAVVRTEDRMGCVGEACRTGAKTL